MEGQEKKKKEDNEKEEKIEENDRDEEKGTGGDTVLSRQMQDAAKRPSGIVFLALLAELCTLRLLSLLLVYRPAEQAIYLCLLCSSVWNHPAILK